MAIFWFGFCDRQVYLWMLIGNLGGTSLLVPSSAQDNIQFLNKLWEYSHLPVGLVCSVNISRQSSLCYAQPSAMPSCHWSILCHRIHFLRKVTIQPSIHSFQKQLALQKNKSIFNLGLCLQGVTFFRFHLTLLAMVYLVL